MALSIEREMVIGGCAGPSFGTLPCSRKGRLRTWMIARTAIALSFCLAFCQVSRAQDPLNDVHIQPPAAAPTAPVSPKSPASPDTSTPALEGKRAMTARPNERIRVDVNLVLVPVTVTDPLNRLVTGLERQDFFVYENNAHRKEDQELLFLRMPAWSRSESSSI